MDERAFDHAQKVAGPFFEAGKNAATFFQPANEAFDNVRLSISFAIEGNEPDVAIFVLLAGDDGADALAEEVLINPLRPVSFVSGERHSANGERLFVAEGRTLFQQVGEAGGLMVLSWGQMATQTVAAGVA